VVIEPDARERVHRKHDAQKRFYGELRQGFGLSAQLAIRVIGKVADAYTAQRGNLAAATMARPDRRAV
jgi:putative transposase